MKSDAEIRDDVINELHWDPQVTEPEALAGEVDYDYQKREVERMANHVRGVAGVQNFIIVRPPPARRPSRRRSSRRSGARPR